jgi:hypothetical protein
MMVVRAKDARHVAVGALAYLVPTFAIGFTWHLQLFAAYYDSLQIYRPDKIIPFGFASILTQGVIFSIAYGRLWRGPRVLEGARRFAMTAALLSWSFTTVAVAAKHPMTSVSRFMLIETAFTAFQFIVVAPLMALAWRAPAIR